MLETIGHGLLVFIGLPASLFIGVLVGKGILQLLSSKSETPVAICAMLSLVVACIFLFGGSPLTAVGDQDRWLRR